MRIVSLLLPVVLVGCPAGSQIDPAKTTEFSVDKVKVQLIGADETPLTYRLVK